MIPAEEFRRYFIRPVLNYLATVEPRIDTLASENLLLGTAIQESRLSYLEQIGGGPGRGFFQIEPKTMDDIFERYLPTRRPDLYAAVDELTIPAIDLHDQLACNPLFSCAVARILFWMDPEPLPSSGDLQGLAEIWKRVYNTAAGKGTASEWALNFRKYAFDDSNVKQRPK